MVAESITWLRNRTRQDWGLVALALSITLIAGTMAEHPPSHLSIARLGLGVMALIVAGLLIDSGVPPKHQLIAATVCTVLIVALTAVRFSDSPWNVPEFVLAQLMALGLAVTALATGRQRRSVVRLLAIATIGLVLYYGIWFAYNSTVTVDVYELHEQAAVALTDGRNPYTTGNVLVVESLPFDGGELIMEYTYPPLTLIAYAGASILLGGSRIAGALAIVIAFGLVLWFVGDRGATGRWSNVDAGVVALLCSLPITFPMIIVGWTEAITLPFLVLAGALWTRRPLASAVALGLALATKQYFVVTVPLLFFIPDPYRWRRAGVAITTAALTFLPFLVWDAGGLINGVVRHHLTRDPRPDAATLVRLGIHIPTAVGVALAMIVGVLIARRVASGGLALLAMAATIAVFTFTSVRGFRNTWWLVASVAVVGLGLLGRDVTSGELDASRSPTSQLDESHENR